MTVKVYYFDARGWAEPIRWILSYGGIEFEDVRVPLGMPPTLPEDIKSKGRWGQVPLVEFDGKTLSQSSTIYRYFAKKTKLTPQGDEYEEALCDEYVDTVKDLMQGINPLIREPDEEKKKQQVKDYTQSMKTKFLDKFEALLKANGGKHLVGNSLTLADVLLASALQQYRLLFGIDVTSEYPAVKALCSTVESAPGIKEWLSKRPNTKF